MSTTNLIVVADSTAFENKAVKVHGDLFTASTLFEAVVETAITGRSIVIRDNSVTVRKHIVDVWNSRGYQYLEVFYRNIEVRESDLKAIHALVLKELARDNDRMTDFLKSFNPMGDELMDDCESAISSGFERAFPFAQAILGRMVHVAFKRRTDNGCF